MPLYKQALSGLLLASLFTVSCGGSKDSPKTPCELLSIGLASQVEASPIEVQLSDHIQVSPEEDTRYTIKCRIPADLSKEGSKSMKTVLEGTHFFASATEFAPGNLVSLIWDFSPEEEALIDEIVELQSDEGVEFVTLSEDITLIQIASGTEPDLTGADPAEPSKALRLPVTDLSDTGEPTDGDEPVLDEEADDPVALPSRPEAPRIPLRRDLSGPTEREFTYVVGVILGRRDTRRVESMTIRIGAEGVYKASDFILRSCRDSASTDCVAHRMQLSGDERIYKNVARDYKTNGSSTDGVAFQLAVGHSDIHAFDLKYFKFFLSDVTAVPEGVRVWNLRVTATLVNDESGEREEGVPLLNFTESTSVDVDNMLREGHNFINLTGLSPSE